MGHYILRAKDARRHLTTPASVVVWGALVRMSWATCTFMAVFYSKGLDYFAKTMPSYAVRAL